MKVSDLCSSADFTLVCGESDCEITGAYAGDLLSWVMSHANAGDVWLTIMSNVNVVAVASLTECACVVLTEGVVPDEGVAEVAKEKGVTIVTTGLTTFGACEKVSKLLSQSNE